MLRKSKHTKFLLHLLYIIMASYIISQRSYKNTTIKKLFRFPNDLRYILIWTELRGISREGQEELIDRHCSKINCYFTTNRTFLSDMRYFDAIVFNLQQVYQGAEDLPTLRAQYQKYIFVANDSSDNFPVCDPEYDRFFNWTWTYKSDSTIPYKFFSVSTSYGQKLDGQIQWRITQQKIDVYRQRQLNSKSKAAAIFLYKCNTRSKREELVKKLQKELAKFNLTVDVFGECGNLRCRRKTMKNCFYRLRKEYFFYLAFEDSMAPDYITGEILLGYLNDAVPIVYGGATYADFLPINSYIDAREFNVTQLAQTMHSLMCDRQLYYAMFSWKQHYVIEPGTFIDPCTLCENLNDRQKLERHGFYENFRNWWNLQYNYRCSRV